MKIMTHKELEELYKLCSGHRSVLRDPDIKLYQLEKLVQLIDSKQMSHVNKIVGMIQSNPDYNYPDEVDETRLDDYWDERLGNPVRDLDLFKAEVQREIYRRSDVTPQKNYTVDELKDWVLITWKDVRPKYPSDNTAKVEVARLMKVKFGKDARAANTIVDWVKGYNKG